MHLSHERVQEICKAAIDSGLVDEQEALLASLPPAYVATLTLSKRPDARLLLALHAMNGVDVLVDGTVPLAKWLRTAIAMTSTLPQHKVFASALADLEGKRSTGRTLPTEGAPHVFLSYSKEDRGQVRQLYDVLCDDGIDAWMDEENLLAGDAWEQRIQDTLRRADFVIVCLSQIAAKKRGYVQVELQRILAEAERRPANEVYILPIRLDAVEIPPSLEHLHHLDLFPDGRAAAERVAQHLRRHSKSR